MSSARPDDSPYPAAMYRWPNPPVEVAADAFVSQEEVARELSCTMQSVGRMIAMGRLRPATSNGRAGVTRASLLEEIGRRKKPLWRVKLLGQTLLHFISF